MFTKGDKVFYQGNGRLDTEKPLEIVKVVNEFVYVKGVPIRYSAKSFRAAKDGPADLLAVLTRRVTEGHVGVCSYALEFDGGYQRFQIEDVCHARLTFGGQYRAKDEQGADLKAVALNVSGHITALKKEFTELYKKHVEYILTESPWRNAFLPKPLEDVYKSGVYLDLSKDFSYCVAAAIALRSGSEYAMQLPMFGRLKDLGFSSNVAYLVSQFSSSDTFVAMGGGHHVINNIAMKMENLAAFFNSGEPVNPSGVSYKDAAGKAYSVFKLIESVPCDRDKSVFAYITDKACSHITETKKKSWGEEYKTINLKDIKNLVIVANAFAKVIK